MQGTIRPISINYEDTKQAIKFWNHLQLDIPYHYNILWIQELSRENKTSPSLQTWGSRTELLINPNNTEM